MQEVKERSTDPKEQEFIHCLLASCDYDSFYSVMVKEASRQSAMQQFQEYRPPAESKSEGKGMDDDDDDDEPGAKGSGAKDAKG